ncbi:MAG: hypothetical protein ACRYGI_01005 [Janthinobacterium lividum]
MADGSGLVGIGLYTVAEAGRLIDVPPPTLIRWLRGHKAHGQWYLPLWKPQVDIGDEKIYLSFRDLMEARVASQFIDRGLSAQKVRWAIALATNMVGERPLSTTWLRTDGRAVFLQVVQETDSEPTIINLFTKQHVFASVVERTFKDVEFEGPFPSMWWPTGSKSGILVDPHRSFGQPIEHETSIPAVVLANAAKAEGSAEEAARAWCVPVRAIKRSVRFQNYMEQKKAA